MSDFPKVTIITPSFNQGRFIEETIQSVLSQAYPNLEYIVIDGGSTDETISILNKYNGKLKWISEKDNGQSDAINKGFKMASGEIVAWLNSDDTYEPGAIKTAVDCFLENPQYVMVYGEGDITDAQSNKLKRFEATQRFDLYALINVWDYIMQPTTFFKRDALKLVGFLDEDLYWCMDWDLWIKLAMVGEVGYINKVIANSREYEETKTSTGGWKRFKEIRNLMSKYSGKKFPYGYFLYGASTLYTESTNKFVKELAKQVLRIVQISIFKNLPVVYSDGWIGRKGEVIVPLYIKELEFLFESVTSQVQTKIFVNGKLVEHLNINENTHYTFKFDENINGKKLFNEITFKNNKCVKPNKTSNSTDSRNLSLRLSVVSKSLVKRSI
ncbi:glycosyltransferase family 2 protein [Paenibacillus chitinolyticus]|uniref:glycosyltransferase family 2 protein n=1 Tax=Paenibacillus TaxID=44249 RepID=UPI001C44DF2E|nr:glycosyltransferase family 2 protein [Paenibacillus chitinolyticus]MBV6716005.1 glycosyltransferase [Paenibacillus chitinolyticus]